MAMDWGRVFGQGASALVRFGVPATFCILVAACGESSYQQAALDASAAGNQKEAVSLARKEVARFDTEDQCSARTNKNCGTLALAYSSLAEYQILAGDRIGGEASFNRARGALRMTDPANQASAAGMIYRDVSEAYWKTGDKARARAIVEQGRAAGADSWVMSGSAGQQMVKEREKAEQEEKARRLAEIEAEQQPAPSPLTTVQTLKPAPPRSR
ncbi:MAG: hypothetical protein JSR47_10865 [Proteobacteria bacterium]|nr:hypothetical protein [Pseudomonadota bacterium]